MKKDEEGMEQLEFIKMQGAGNDFIMIEDLKTRIKDFKRLARELCDRHFGIGGDGLIIVLPPEKMENDFRMRIFNSDGSEAEMCGNGIRCFAHYLYEQGLADCKVLKIETLAGIITPEYIDYHKGESQIKVDMGRPRFKPEEIPVNIENVDLVLEYPVEFDKEEFSINCVSMGNPHTIIFVDSLDEFPLEKWGRIIENHPLFPEKTNVEFIKILKRDEIQMKVWERGSGITLACGTGATASVVAGIKNGYLDNKVLVHLPGGDLVIEWKGQSAFMTGPARTVFYGKIYI
jgi:diaminopimelate epimerase